ncbi:MAG TPA: PRC-barrel domain-containing protein [Candidatus Binatia bacterium]|nr:PRC-barrel domain-containing protein [Candidatus Binatia bacterium]
MLRRMKDLKGFAIAAKDGDIGAASDFIFDDKNWTVRYVVVDTNPWLPGGKVLISPIITGQADWENKKLPVLLTRKQVKNSPNIRMEEELSAQDEVKYYDHYGWPYYWVGTEMWGPVTVPQDLLDKEVDRKIARTHQANQSRLRSMQEVRSYTIQATDGEVGEVDDFIIDDEPWVIRYMVVDTGNWLPAKKVVVAPTWISHVDWKNSKVHVNLSRETIKAAPEFEADQIGREYEQALYKHYGQETYWWC